MELTRRSAVLGSLASGVGARKLAASESLVVGRLVLRDPPRAVPAFRFVGEDGRGHGLGEYLGRGVVLNLWATWCGPCVAELPALAKLARALAGDGIVVLPISADRGGVALIRRFYAAHDIADLGVWLDSDQSASEAVGAEGLPTTLIIDRRGLEVGRIAGAADWTSAAATVRVLCRAGA